MYDSGPFLGPGSYAQHPNQRCHWVATVETDMLRVRSGLDVWNISQKGPIIPKYCITVTGLSYFIKVIIFRLFRGRRLRHHRTLT